MEYKFWSVRIARNKAVDVESGWFPSGKQWYFHCRRRRGDHRGIMLSIHLGAFYGEVSFYDIRHAGESGGAK